MSTPKKRGRVKGRHELKSRDLDLIQFLEQTKLYITTDQASRLFYWSGNPVYSLKTAQARMKILSQDLKQIKRFREYTTQSYAYYISSTAPRMHKHRLANTDFLSYFVLIPGVEVVSITHEWNEIEKDYHLRPDLRVEFYYNDVLWVMIVEVDVGKAFHNDQKYCHLLDDIVRNPRLQELFPRGNTFIVNVCKRPPKASFPIWWVQPDMTGLSEIEAMLRGETDVKR